MPVQKNPDHATNASSPTLGEIERDRRITDQSGRGVPDERSFKQEEREELTAAGRPQGGSVPIAPSGEDDSSVDEARREAAGDPMTRGERGGPSPRR